MADIEFRVGYKNENSSVFDGLVPAYIYSDYTSEEWPLSAEIIGQSTEVDYTTSYNNIYYETVLEDNEAVTNWLPGFYCVDLSHTTLNDKLAVGGSADAIKFVTSTYASVGIRIKHIDDYIVNNNLYWSGYELEIYYRTLDMDYTTETVVFSGGLTNLAADRRTAQIPQNPGHIYLAVGFQYIPETKVPLIYLGGILTTKINELVTYPDISQLSIDGTVYRRLIDDGSYFNGDGASISGITDSTLSYSGAGLIVFNMSKFCEDNETEFEPAIEASPEAGPASEPDGMNDPPFDDSSDSISLPDVPTSGVSNVGFVNVYKTSSNSLQNMGVELFPALAYTAPTPISSGSTTDAIIDGFNSIVTFLSNVPSFFEQTVAATLINYIIDCHVIPVTPSGGTSEAIKVGYKTLTCRGDRMSNDYVDFDCGTISLAEYYQSFIDHTGTSAKLFLPFVGFVPARTEWFYRDSLNVTYRFNIIDGSFMAYVRSTGAYVNNNNSGSTVVAQYSGNACIHLPITGVTYSNMVSGLVGAGAGAVASAGSGSVVGATTSALNAASLRGDMPQSNAYTASGSFLSVRRPFLMIERSVSHYSKTYQKEIGIPSNISRKLSTVRGFAIVGDIHLDGITATDQEKAELETLLSKGVIF